LLVEENPVNTVMGYAPLLAAVEESIRRESGKLIRFEIMLLKANQNAVEALPSGKVDIVKIGCNSYLKARKLNPDLHLLVSQNPPKRGVIFTRKDSGITRLEDLKNRSMVFGDRYSTISTWACYHLVQAGITATNLKYFDFPDSISSFAT